MLNVTEPDKKLIPDSSHLTDFVNWLKRDALPVWIQQGIDSQGSSIEQFDADGQPDLVADKRVRVQARQMFVFAAAQKQGWIKDGAELVKGLDSFCMRHAWVEKKRRFAHVLGPDNSLLDDRTDLYDIAFFLLSYAWRYHVFNDPKALEKADGILNDIDLNLKEKSGGWLEGDYQTPYRRQNPHMHLFEAFLALYNVTHDGKWLAKAGEIYCLFETVFFDHDNGVLFEYFMPDWKPLDNEKGAIIEPGHMMEWVWLLRQYQKVTGTPVETYCQTLYHQALTLGLDSSSGLLFDAVTLEGPVDARTKRCWPMTEWIKAALAQATKAKDTHSYLQDACLAAHTLQSIYLNGSKAGLYIDSVDVNNRVLNGKAPASTLYHLMVAAMECDAFIDKK